MTVYILNVDVIKHFLTSFGKCFMVLGVIQSL